MTAGKKFCLILAVSFISALLIGIANKISVGLWPNVLPDAALIIRSLVAAFVLTAFLFIFFVERLKDREWLILAIGVLVFIVGLSLAASAWPAENPTQNICFQKTL